VEGKSIKKTLGSHLRAAGNSVQQTETQRYSCNGPNNTLDCPATRERNQIREREGGGEGMEGGATQDDIVGSQITRRYPEVGDSLFVGRISLASQTWPPLTQPQEKKHPCRHDRGHMPATLNEDSLDVLFKGKGIKIFLFGVFFMLQSNDIIRQARKMNAIGGGNRLREITNATSNLVKKAGVLAKNGHLTSAMIRSRWHIWVNVIIFQGEDNFHS